MSGPAPVVEPSLRDLLQRSSHPPDALTDPLRTDRTIVPPPLGTVSVRDTLALDSGDRQLTQSLTDAQATTPDTHARVVRMQLRTGLPAEVISRNLDSVEREAARNGFDPKKFREESPVVAQWFQNPDNAAVAHDDVQHLSALERLFGSWDVRPSPTGLALMVTQTRPGSLQQATTQGVAQIEDAQIGVRRIMGTATPADEARHVALQRWTQPQGYDAWRTQTTPRGFIEDAAVQAAQQLPNMAYSYAKGARLALGGALAGAAAGAVTGAGAPVAAAGAGAVGLRVGVAGATWELEAGGAMNEYLDGGMDPKAAKIAATVVGIVNAGIEVGGLEVMMHQIPGVRAALGGDAGGAVRRALQGMTRGRAALGFVKGFAAVQATEMTQEVSQEISTIVGGVVGQQLSSGKFVPQTPEQMADRILQTAIQTFKATMFLAPLGPGAEFLTNMSRATAATQRTEALQAFGETAKASKLRERLPEKFREFVAQVREQGPVESVMIPVEQWKTYWQGQHLDPAAVAAEVTGDVGQYFDAETRGGDLVIPLENYATQLAASDHHEALSQDIRLRQSDWTAREAKAWADEMATTQGARIGEAAPGPVEDQAVRTPLQKGIEESATDFETKLTAQLRDAGTAESEAATQAQITTAGLRVMSERMGRNLFEEYGVDLTHAQEAPSATEATMRRPTRRKPLSRQSREELYAYLDDTEQWLQRHSPAQMSGTYVSQSSYGEAVVGNEQGGMGGHIWRGVAAMPDKIEAELVARGETAEEVRANLEAFKQDREERAAIVAEETADGEDGMFFQGGIPPELRFDAEKAAVIRLLGKQQAWEESGRAAFVRGEGPSFGGEVPRAMDEQGRPTDATRRTLEQGPVDPTPPRPALTPDMVNAIGIRAAQKAMKAAGRTELTAEDIEAGIAAMDKIAPRVLEQSAAPSKTARAKAFKKWFGKSKVVDESGKPLIVYHGTVTNFDTFDASRGNVEADFGRGIYFTNEPEDVSANYAGLGPDITQKIELKAERLAQDDDIPIEEARQQIKNELVEHGGAVMPVYLRFLNPAILGGEGETVLTLNMEQDADGEFTGEESGTLLDFAQALRDVASRYDDGDVTSAVDEMISRGLDGDGLTLREALDILRKDSEFNYFIDDSGDLASHEIVREAIERTGFDGIIDHTVDEKFGSQRRTGRSMEGMTPETTHYIAFEPTQIKSATGNRGTFDASDPNILHQEARGSITIQGRQFNIRLLPSADRSTFLHETGHLFLSILSDADPNSEDLATLRDWLGNDGGEFTTEQHEQFARGFEAYLMEGKAPSAPLRAAFSRFKAWLIALYGNLRRLNVSLTPEVRSVMDRMVATDREIAAASQAQGYTPLAQETLGATDAEYATYTASAERATVGANERLLRDLMAEDQRESSQFWTAETERTRAIVARELEADPAYQALHYLQRGERLDGAHEGDPADAVRLSKQILTDRYGEGIIEELRAIGGKVIYAAKDGADPDVVAGMFGYESGDQLIPALLEKTSRPLQAEIERETQARMLAKHPDMMHDSATLARKAQETVHEGAEAGVLLTELRLLGRQLGQRLPPRIEALRAEATALVEKQRVRDIKPYTYQRDEATAARQAEKAGRAGDIPTAQAWKRRQLLNHLAYRIATETRESVDKAATYLKGFTTDKVRAKLGLAGADYLEQIDRLLERFEFRDRTLKSLDRRASLAAWITKQEELGLMPAISDELRSEAFTTNYQNLTATQLYDLRDAVKNIAHLAALKNRLTEVNAGRELQETAAELGASIRANGGDARPARLGDPSAAEVVRDAATAFLARHQKLASFIRIMDGQQDNGPMYRLFLRSINDAQNHEAVRLNHEGQRTTDIYEAAYTAAERADMLSKRENVPGVGMMTKMTRLMVALNVGTEDNRTKLLDGHTEHLDEDRLARILDTLDERDWKYVQAVWDQIGSYWQEVSDLHERLTGLPPERVEPRIVHTRFGDFKGGYFPIDYDPSQSPDAYAHQIAAQADLLKKGAAVRASTRQGFTKSRVASTDRPLRLSPNVIYRHQSDVIHYLTHQEMILDANRLLKHPDVRGAILQHYGMATYREMTQALTDLAAGTAQAYEGWARPLGYIRQGASAALLGWNITTTALQGMGLANGIVRVGAKYIGFGVANAFKGGPKGFMDVLANIQSRSEFMEQRVNNTQRDLAEALNRMRKTGKIDHMRAAAYSFIARGQLMADVPTWLGAYQKATEQFPESTEAERVGLADQAVKDSQGGGLLVDQAGIERSGPIQKLLTTFMSYGVTVLQQNVELIKRTKFSDPRSVVAFLTDGLLLNVLPIAMAGLVRAGMRGDWPDPEDIARDWIASLLNMFIGLREFAGPIQTGHGTGKLLGDYSGPAGLRVVGATITLAQQAAQGEADAAFFRALNMEGGLLFHYPALQFQRTVEGTNALLSGKTVNPLVLLGGPPRTPR